MSSEYGKILKVSLFGQSHGPAIGVNIDGLPAGEAIDMEELNRFLARRRPGQALTTARREGDQPIFLSGIENGYTCGFPICAIIENQDIRSSDYRQLADQPRPGHADYTAHIKYGGYADMRGGGHFSGRLTAPLCIAGGIALQILARRGIAIGAHLVSVADIKDTAFPLFPDRELFRQIAERQFPVIDEEAGQKMAIAIKQAAEDLDSLGGMIEAAVIGLPAGLGGPLFGGLESRLAAALFAVPAVKGLDFGAGFAVAAMKGSDNNDSFIVKNGHPQTSANHHGGILGGISSGMPLILHAAIKPTPSIGQKQNTINLSSMKPVQLAIEGRHDPCIALRAVPVLEAVIGIVILDILLEGTIYGNF